MKRIILLAMFVLSGMISMLHAETDSVLRDIVYVDASRGDWWWEDCDGSLDKPYGRIQDGIDNANTNALVVVAPGTYDEKVTLSKYPVRVVSSGCATNTFIKYNASSVVVIEKEASGSLIDGFSVVMEAGGEGTYIEDIGLCGGGFLCRGSADIANCIIKDCSIVYAWTTGNGGGIYVEGEGVTVKVSNSLIVGCSADQGTIAYVREMPYDAETGSTLIMEDCTIYGNNCGYDNYEQEDCGGVYIGFGSNFTLKNSIFWENYPKTVSGYGNFDVIDSCIENGLENLDGLNVNDQGGNNSEDPWFVDKYEGDFRVEEWSSSYGKGYSVDRYPFNIRQNDTNEYVYELSEDGNGIVITFMSNKTSHVEFPFMIDGRVVVQIGMGYDTFFAEPASVESVRFPVGVGCIDGGCLSGTSIKELDIPNGVTNILGEIRYCNSLGRVRIPASMGPIKDGYITRYCPIVYFEVAEENKWNSSDGVGSLFDKNKKILMRVSGGGDIYTYEIWQYLANYRVPNTVECVADAACEGLNPIYRIWLTLPASVTNIQASSFWYCQNINVSINEDNPCYKSVGQASIYNKEGTVLINHRMGDIAFLPSVTNIEFGAFHGARELRSILIPDNITQIGQFAFCRCNDLEEVVLPKNVETLDWTFAHCESLKRVVMPEGSKVKNLYNGMFQYCSNLTEVVLTEGAEVIGYSSFIHCVALPELIVPESVKEFRGIDYCTALTNLSFRGAPPKGPGSIYGTPNIVGYYRAKYAQEWKSVLDAEGKWYGIPMRQRAMVTNTVTFVVGEHGRHTGDELEQRVFDEESATAPDIEVDENWCFIGWDADFSNVISNMTINAVYREKVVVALDANEGSVSPDSVVGANTMKIGALPVPERENYIFLGWFTAAEGGELVTSETIVTLDLTAIYAQWKEKSYFPSQLFGGEWTSGIDGIAEAAGYFDSTIDCGFSVRFDAESDSSVWIEQEVTNSCKVTFRWKSSCEDLFKGSPYDYLSFEVDGVRKGFVCGESDWREVTFEVRGNGVHSLRWAFQRDNEGEGGSNRAWLADVDITRILSVDFADGGAVVGTVPDACEYYEGESVVVPDCGSLSYPKHTFAGWSDGAATFMPGDIYSSESDALLTAIWKRNELESPVISGPEMFEADTCVIEISSADGLAIRYTLDGSDPTEESPLYSTPITITQTTTIKAIVVKENHFDSPVAEFTVVRGVWTFGEYLNCPDMQFVTAGDAEWMRAKNVSDDGYAMRSGDITHSQTSRLEVVVNGSGMIAFKCKVEGEIAKNIIWDGLAFSIDGVRQGGLMGNEAWMQKTYFVEGKGAHTLCWSYVKDESGEGNGEDCAWLDEIVWIPGHIPELPNTVTAEEIAIVLGGSADEKLAANITSAADYAAFRAWALEVKGADGALAGGEAVKKSPNAWLSYALDTAGLIIAEPKEGDVAIEAFESAVSDGAFDISVKVAGVDVGEGAKEANLKKVFAVEGVSDLGSGTFTSESLEVDAAQSANGKVKFTVSPKGDKPAQFFFKVKMK